MSPLHRQPVGSLHSGRPVYAKAIVAGLLALATWGATAFAPDEDGVSRVTEVEWFTLLGAVVTAAATYLTRNGVSPDPTTSTPDVDGAGMVDPPAF